MDFNWLKKLFKKSGKFRQSPSNSTLPKANETPTLSLLKSQKPVDPVVQLPSANKSHSMDDFDKMDDDDSNVDHRQLKRYKSDLINNGNEARPARQRTCRICLLTKSNHEFYSLLICGHRFCRSCMICYLSQAIEGDVTGIEQPICPDTGCNAYVEPSEIRNLVEYKLYELFARRKLSLEVERDPRRVFCPNCDLQVCNVRSSSRVVAGHGVEMNRVSEEFYCEQCRVNYCAKCMKRWHPDGGGIEVSCSSDQIGSDLGDVVESQTIKRCPRCSILIEKLDEGCNQMMCKKCRHVFCWFCLKSLEDDYLLRHYDKGPCKNKLGHSKATIFFHRFQIIGLFAGFATVLLLASPLFLLAAPCIICSNCCSCCLKQDDVSRASVRRRAGRTNRRTNSLSASSSSSSFASFLVEDK